MEETLLAGDFLLVNKAAYGAYVGGHRWGLWPNDPARGDVIVFRPPHLPAKFYVKRVVGLPGDTLEMRDGRLFINGRILQEPYVIRDPERRDGYHPDMKWQQRFLAVDEDPGPGGASRFDPGDRQSRYQRVSVAERTGRPSRQKRPTRNNWGPLSVPAGKYFVLGDNRDNSEDSRYWGYVERTAIVGQPWRVYYSKGPHDKGGTWASEIRWDRIGDLVE